DRWAVTAETDENEPHEDFHLQGPQPELALVDAGETVFARHAHQPAVEIIEEPMITAAHGPAAIAAVAFQQPIGTMAADIMESLQAALLVAQDDRAFAQKIETQEIAGLLHLADMADQLPGFEENGFALERKEFVIGIDPGRQRDRDHGVHFEW